jgi:hypothetical protein
MITMPIIVAMHIRTARRDTNDMAIIPSVIAGFDDFCHNDRPAGRNGGRCRGGQSQTAEGRADNERESGKEPGHSLTSSQNGVG